MSIFVINKRIGHGIYRNRQITAWISQEKRETSGSFETDLTSDYAK